MANETKKTLEFIIRNNADGKMIARKLCTPKAKEKKAAHQAVCKKLVELSDKNGQYPITYLVYFSVGKNAHRTNILEDGYSKIDVKKATTILNWLKMVASANKNGTLFRNTNLSHALCKYYDTISKKTTDFEKVLPKIKTDANGKIGDFKSLEKTMGIDKVVKAEKEAKKVTKKVVSNETANKAKKSVSKAVSTKNGKTTKTKKDNAVESKKKASKKTSKVVSKKKTIDVKEINVASSPSAAKVETANVAAN